LGIFVPTDKPDRAEIPAQKDVDAMVKDYKGNAAVAQGEAFDATPKGIAARTVFSTAPSGLKLAVVSKKTRGGSVSFEFHFHLGDEKSLEGKSTAGNFAAGMLMRGSVKHTRAEISDLFDKAKAQVHVGGNAEEATVTGETTKEHLAEVLQLVAEILKEPSFPTSEFEQLQQQWLASLEQARTEPTAIGQIAFRRMLNPYPKGHVRYSQSLEERIDAIKTLKLEDVKAFYQTFYGASGGALAVVGDVEAKQTQELIQASFGSWKSPTAYVYMPPLTLEKPAQVQTLETPDKTNACFFAGLPVSISETDSDFAAAALGNFMLGGGFINSRLATRIRQKEGLSYGVGSNLTASPMGEEKNWTAYAIFAPQNLSRLEAAFHEELEKALKDGFTAEEIKAAKSGILQERQVSRSQDNELASMLVWNLPLGRPLSFEDELDQKFATATGDQIVTALRKIIDPAKLVIVKAGDFAKAAKSEPKK
jgi:zinc protease